MNTVVQSLRLTHEGAMKVLQACIDNANAINRPVTISVCDASGVLMACCRMDGSYFLTVETSLNKAATAAATSRPTGGADDAIAIKLGVATFGKQTIGLKGGVPIIVDGHCIGGIGAGSATGDEDLEIALAGLAVVEGAQIAFD